MGSALSPAPLLCPYPRLGQHGCGMACTVLQGLLLGAAWLQLEGSKSRSEEFPPSIIDHPADLVVRWDQPATLNCRAAGSPQPTIEWYRNGQRVETSKDNVHSQRTLLPDGALFFLRLSQQKGHPDEGLYSCVATNRLGKASSRNASLYVAALREDFQLQPSNLVVSVGEQVLLVCAPPRGRPEPTISWKKDGLPISQRDGRYELSGGKLLVVRAQRNDAGRYVCVASNLAGERESKAALVSVLEKPSFTRRPSDTVARGGSAVQLACGVWGDPLPQVRWHKEQGELPWGRHEVDAENTLRIHSVMALDSGRYICTAQNQAGTATAGASLSVEEPLDAWQTERPKDAPGGLADMQLYLDNSTVLPSSAAVYLHWKVIGPSRLAEGHEVLYRPLAPLSADWLEQKVPTEHSAIVPALRRGYKYEFKVRPYAGQAHGPDSNVRHLWIPEEVPSAAPQRVAVMAVGDGNGTVLITWDPPPHHAHNGILRGYKVWYLGNETHHHSNRTVDGGTHSLEVVVLPAGEKYCVQVAAFNGAGLGVPSNATCSHREPAVGRTARTPAALSFSHILAVIRQPVFIASMGSLLWLMLMALAVHLCQQRARHPSRGQLHAPSKGLCRYASAAPMLRQSPGLETSNSPWLAAHWKAPSCSKSFSSSRSSSQLLWAETKDSPAWHRSAVSFDRQSQGSQLPAAAWASDSSSLCRVDLPARDVQPFPWSPQACAPGPYPSTARPGPRDGQSLGMERGVGESGLWKPAGLSVPSLAQPGPWHPELQQAHSSPVLLASPPACTTSPGGSSAKRTADRGAEAKVLETFSPLRLLEPGGAQRVTGTLPLPPAPHGPQGQAAHSGHRQVSAFLPHTYGYICSPLPSELGAGPALEDDDPKAKGGGCHPLRFSHQYCRTPSSSSLGGSLLNAWGSVSEENFTSPRCSLVSSSDGSFLADASFAQALAVAGDSFCFGLSSSAAEQSYADFLPPASPLDGLLAAPAPWASPAWEWSTGWLEELEDTCCRDARAEGSADWDPALAPCRP
ncbi:roundabout homolog 4 isoform X2 [Carettochelys insculpta]|uniref:roundabout homolog 4 isoform X2 n=1 Tax=Carettochelys insculpta TaxID=44489 RepID=UPI003EBDE3AA